jgi:hypothetical protein
MKTHGEKKKEEIMVSVCCNGRNTTADWGDGIYTKCDKCKQKCEVKWIEKQ